MTRDGVAVLHTGAWGDLYVATAALSSVAQLNPGRPLFVVGSAKWLQILRPHGEIWKTLRGIVVSEDGWRGTRHAWIEGEWRETARVVKLTDFFREIQASYNLRTESLRFAWAPFLAGVPQRHGSTPALWNRLLYTNRAPWLGKDPLIHERDRMLQVIEAPDNLSELAHEWSRTTGLPRLKEANPAKAEKLASAKAGHYWLINPTSSRREKAWPAARFCELYVQLAPILARASIELRILGAPWETEWLKETQPSGVNALVQPESTQALLDVLSGAKALITNTSSTQFLAPGCGVRTLTLMGRSDPRIWGPLGPRDLVVRGEIDPLLSDDIFQQERRAYESITVDRVLAACMDLL